uniref:Uncharacterized protein n=1 Tax=Cannabis sativa TaxID=3483 RepID=A0A803QRM1_CANSA
PGVQDLSSVSGVWVVAGVLSPVLGSGPIFEFGLGIWEAGVRILGLCPCGFPIGLDLIWTGLNGFLILDL